MNDEQRIRVLSHPADFGQRFATRDELAEKRKKEGLAEAPNWRLRFEVEGMAYNIAVVFIEDDPEAQVRIEACSPFLYDGDFDGKAALLGLFG